MEPAVQLPVTPLGEDEWRPWWERSHTDRAMLPRVVDEQVLGYPLREVIGRLRHRGPRGGSRSAQVGWANGNVTSYGDYLVEAPQASAARFLTEARAFAALRSARQSGCVFGAVGRRTPSGLAPLLHDEMEAGVCLGVVFDLALSDYVTVFDSELLVADGEYLQISLRTCAVPVTQLDPLVPGAALVREMLTAENWPWLG
jgi:hypothetical protein